MESTKHQARPPGMGFFICGALGLLIIKLLWILAMGSICQTSWQTLPLGHDGSEYVLYGQLVSEGRWAEVPPSIRRHHPGMPLLIAPFAAVWPGTLPAGWFTPEGLRGYLDSSQAAALGWAAVVLGWLGSAVGVAVLAWRLRGLGSGAMVRYGLLAMFGWPALAYYGCFALSEGVFGALLSVMFVCWVQATSQAIGEFGGRRWMALMVVCGLAGGLAAWVRGAALVALTGLVAVGFVAALHRRARKTGSWAEVGGSLLPLLLAVGLYGGLQVGLSLGFDGPGTPAGAVKPSWGWPPWAGMQGLSDLGFFRAAYLVFGVGLLVVLWGLVLARLLWFEYALDRDGFFCWGLVGMGGALLLFHLSLASLVYYGQVIPLANYQDRYLGVLWPFFLTAFPVLWQTRRAKWFVGASLLASLVLSLWWGRGYFAALAQQGYPLVEALSRS